MKQTKRQNRKTTGKRTTNTGKNRKRPRIPKPEFSRVPIVTKLTPIGLFVYQDTKFLKKKLWGKTPETAANHYFRSDEEIKEINNTIPIKARRTKEGVFGEQLLALAIENGFKEEEFREFFQRFSLELTKLKLKYGFKKDRLVIQAVSAFEEANKMLNIFYERLSEWYGFYYPESVKKIENLEEFAEIAGRKRHEKSMGYDIEEEDLKAIHSAGEEMRCMIKYRNMLMYYIEDLMCKIAPNLSQVAGHIIGAKLIASAGSLEKLSKRTSSTVQLLGAEKALFRHLRRGAKPPKYGIILQHAMMKQIAPSDRGRFARTLAGKITIAAKVDFNSEGKEKVWKTLVEELESRLKRIN